MFQVFHIAGLLKFHYTCEAYASTHWTVSRFALSILSDDDRSRWEVHLVSDRQRAVIGWDQFLVHYRPVDVDADSVAAFIESKLNAIEAYLRAFTGGSRFSLFSRRKRRLPTGQSLWSPDDGFRQWILPGIVLEGDAHHHGAAELLRPLLQGIEADRKLIRMEAGEAARTKHATPVAIPDPDTPLPEDMEPLLESYAEVFNRQLNQSLANSKRLLSLGDRSNSPSGIESIVCSTIQGALTMALLENASRIFPDQTADVLVDVSGGGNTGALLGDRYSAAWEEALPIWNTSLTTKVPIRIELSLQPGARGDKGTVEPLFLMARKLMHAWVVERSEPLSVGGQGWICLLPEIPWNEEVFAIWLGMTTLHEQIRCLDDLPGCPSSATDPNRKDRQRAWDQLLESLAERSDALDLGGWRGLLPHLGLWNERMQPRLVRALKARICKVCKTASSGSMEIRQWMDIWTQAAAALGTGTATDSREIFAALVGRCESSKDLDSAELLLSFWIGQGRDPERVPILAATFRKAHTLKEKWLADLCAVLDDADDRRRASELLAACLSGSGLREIESRTLPLVTLAESGGHRSRWNTAESDRIDMARLVDAWASELDRSQDLEGWKDLLDKRRGLQQLGLYEG